MTTTSVGQRFAEAIATKDAAGLKALLRPDVDFAALTPGRPWESRDATEVVDSTILGTWFTPERKTELVATETAEVGGRQRVGYLFDVDRPDGRFTLEQQAYFEVTDGQISWLRILCSGFEPAE